ncbi:Stage III sporulation protein AC/AD protein family protein [Sporotomaculum syntrophicum]|uniref:Stage III sporulation protein AC/AD protein family protein n=1 Tax=Sporotomaculum syntrophicum TaxID=182264 RepID=A0A9D2WTW3_9FIRM|nr:stage III sporulation protein AD [Sporotomaculum syntrophicum]KAF1086542.1 Stage III sporulation protein AC/AD protein family protein [Sporotomaculum syntrophicum]
MDILQISGIALTGAVLAVVLKQKSPPMAVLLSIAVGVIIFLLVLGKIGAIVDILQQLSERADISTIYLGTLLKIIGIAYIADFIAQICRDADQGAFATKIELAAKIMVLVLAVPIVVAVLQALLRLVP